jgi:hypothetical protein
MPSLANLLENYRNWKGRQDWQSGKEMQDYFGGDPVAQEQFEQLSGFGTGSHGMQGGIAGTFAGLKSLSADRAAWNKAQLAEKLGKPAEETWLKHGWGRPEYDPQWRYEIPDEMSRLKNPEAFNTSWEKFRDLAEKEKYGRSGARPSQMSRKEYSEYNTFTNDVAKRWNEINPHRSTVGNILEHPELFAAYPDLAKLEVLQAPSSSPYKGSLSRLGESGTPFIKLRENLSSDEAKSTLLHELQHAIQEKEGFASGGEIDDFLKMINPETGKNYTTEEAIEKYRRLGGEVESRLTQKRLDYALPGQRGLLYPWSQSQIDVPISEIGEQKGLTGLSKQ